MNKTKNLWLIIGSIVIIVLSYVFVGYWSGEKSTQIEEAGGKSLVVSTPSTLIQTPKAINTEELHFRLFNTLPITGEEVTELLAGMEIDFDRESLRWQGYSLTFDETAGVAGLTKPGFIRMNNEGIVYDTISSFRATVNEANDLPYVEFIGAQNHHADGSFYHDVFLMDINEDFLTEHALQLVSLEDFTDPALSTSILPDVANYLRSNLERDELWFTSPDEEFTDLEKELAANFTIRLRRVQGFPHLWFFIATFEPRTTEHSLVPFSVFYTRGQISRFGFYFNYVCFSIDGQWFLGLHHQVTPNSGHWGKMLFTYENVTLKLIAEDYSFAD